MTLLFLTLLATASPSPAPTLKCTAPKRQQAKVEELRQSYSDSALYKFAVRSSGPPVRCEGRQGKTEFDARLSLTFADGSKLTLERLPPESGTETYVSGKSIIDAGAVMKLLKAEQAHIDWSKHDDDHDAAGIVTQTYWEPDSNTRVFLRYRGQALVGFGQSFAL